MRLMLTGIEPSMFLTGTVSVTNASVPRRCAWIIETGAGIRTMGASGGPFFPHARHTMIAKTVSHTGHEDFLKTTKVAKSTKAQNKSYFALLLFSVTLPRSARRL